MFGVGWVVCVVLVGMDVDVVVSLVEGWAEVKASSETGFVVWDATVAMMIRSGKMDFLNEIGGREVSEILYKKTLAKCDPHQDGVRSSDGLLLSPLTKPRNWRSVFKFLEFDGDDERSYRDLLPSRRNDEALVRHFCNKSREKSLRSAHRTTSARVWSALP